MGFNREYTIITRGMLATDFEIEFGEVVPASQHQSASLANCGCRSVPASAVLIGRCSATGYEIRDTINSVSYMFDFDCKPKPGE